MTSGPPERSARATRRWTTLIVTVSRVRFSVFFPRLDEISDSRVCELVELLLPSRRRVGRFLAVDAEPGSRARIAESASTSLQPDLADGGRAGSIRREAAAAPDADFVRTAANRARAPPRSRPTAPRAAE